MGQEAVARLEAGRGTSLAVQDGDMQIMWNDTRLWHADTVGSGAVGMGVAEDGRVVLLDERARIVWGAGPEDPAACPPFKWYACAGSAQ